MKPVTDLLPHATFTDPKPGCSEVLAYLKDRIPSYPFNPKIDNDFVDELVDDFANIDIIDELKAFRWYYDNEPVAKVSNVRLSIRRWIANAKDRYRY